MKIGLSLTSMGFITFLVFLVLKLTNVVAWNWFWVWFPLWIAPLASIVLVFIAAGVLFLIDLHSR